mmetsp:Transcript_23175/g.58744  ORF Transcript_23175/g.58744 Transcript_23175/m.58744 type:complete len:197 (+) Transcript_23175:670-1260(+)
MLETLSKEKTALMAKLKSEHAHAERLDESLKALSRENASRTKKIIRDAEGWEGRVQGVMEHFGATSNNNEDASVVERMAKEIAVLSGRESALLAQCSDHEAKSENLYHDMVRLKGTHDHLLSSVERELQRLRVALSGSSFKCSPELEAAIAASHRFSSGSWIRERSRSMPTMEERAARSLASPTRPSTFKPHRNSP